jgi:CheY-like chemotaxis protein
MERTEAHRVREDGPPREPRARPLRVLLVEDTENLRYAFGVLLRMNGYEVREAKDGREALGCLAKFRPQVIVTDLMMPIMGGQELIGRLRADPQTAAIPIVAITADGTEQAELQARAAGALTVIIKPVNLPVLLDAIRALDL